MRLAIFLILGGLVSCASEPVNHWQGLDTDTSPATSPIDCGSFPYPDESSQDGISYGKSGVKALDAYRTCSEANKAIAAEHKAQIEQLKLARKGLTEAGRAQFQVA